LLSFSDLDVGEVSPVELLIVLPFKLEILWQISGFKPVFEQPISLGFITRK
jgi:hypothetical protein